MPVYVLLALGEAVFVLPRVAGRLVTYRRLCGAVFGLITYGVYA